MSALFGEPLSWFMWEMAKQLQRNCYKNGWRAESLLALLRRLRQETRELEAVMRRASGARRPSAATAARLAQEAADVANFAMMIADNARRLASP